MSEAQKTNEKVVKYPQKKKPTTVLYTVLALLIVGICIYQIFKINYSPVKTEIALEKTVSKAVTTDGFVVRDETYITADAVGTLVPLVTDGKRVARGDNVAVVFTSEESARVYSQMQSVEADIAYFESLKNKIGIQTSDVEAMDERVYSACETYVTAIADGDIDVLESYEDTVCEMITSRQLSTGTVIDPTEKLNSLYTQLDALKAQAGGFVTIQANNPGYYIGHVDGYETACAYDTVLQVTGEQIEALLQSTPTSTEDLKNCMGKLVDSFNWYILCVIDAESAGGLSSGSRITVDFPLTSAEPISAEVVSVQNAGTDKAAVILRSNLMNAQYAALRKEQVRLVLENFTGYQVNNKAIREVDGVKGVYTVSGNIIKFKKIEIAYSDSEYSVCVTPKDDNGNPKSGYVALYDEIIVEGTDLYDGKILG
ncbi:MAG: HlyD family efflux transporter periplasmic adaptor subunit [Candidatus Fimenecus sp.]